MRNSQVLLSVLALCVACLAQSPSNVQVNLSLPDEKAVYKAGEPILLRGASCEARLSDGTVLNASEYPRHECGSLKGRERKIISSISGASARGC